MKNKKVLITSRSFGQVSAEPETILKESGFEPLFYNQGFEEEAFRRRIADCDALIIGSHPLSEQALIGAPRLKIICKHGTGLDNIDLDLTSRYGITVTNVPAVNSNAVADLAFSLMLNAARRTAFAARQVKEGVWTRVVGVDVYGKSLAIIGFGEIGRCMARRGAGFDMDILVYDPALDKLPEEFTEAAALVSFEEALAKADFLSLHVPLNENTRHLIGAREIDRMKRSSILINTARGGIVDEAALVGALKDGRIAGAAVDVLEEEPPSRSNPILSFDNVEVTPHIGMYSFEAINAVSVIAARKTARFFEERML